jgi:hypothetical protein
MGLFSMLPMEISKLELSIWSLLRIMAKKNKNKNRRLNKSVPSVSG